METPEIEFRQYVIVPKFPRMSKGKIASQVAHATFVALLREDKDIIEKWKNSGMCVIVLQCRDHVQLMGIDKYLTQWRIRHHMYIDEGFTEVRMGTPTALATGILTPDKIWMFSQLSLFR